MNDRGEEKNNDLIKDHIITISGLPGSGTSTAAELLSEKTGLELVSSGEVFREMAEKRGMSLNEFGRLAEEDEEIDRELDSKMLERADRGTILEGRLTGHFLKQSQKKAFKVWLKADRRTRVKRIADREDGSLEDILQRVKIREKSERVRYKENYDLDLDDKSIYDLVINSQRYSPDEITEKIIEEIKHETYKGKESEYI